MFFYSQNRQKAFTQFRAALSRLNIDFSSTIKGKTLFCFEHHLSNFGSYLSTASSLVKLDFFNTKCFLELNLSYETIKRPEVLITAGVRYQKNANTSNSKVDEHIFLQCN